MAAFRLPRFELLLVLLLVAACAAPGASMSPSPTATAAAVATPTAPPATPTAAPAFPVTLTDDEGTKVAIAAEPARIVSLTPDTTETLFAIGAGSRVVGKVEDVANFPPEAASVPIVARFSGIDIEQIVALEPDLVISGGVRLTQGDAVEQLRRAGIAVLVSYPTTVDGGLASIRRVGQAVGLAAEAATLADSIRTRIDQLATLAAGATSKPRVFYEIDVTGGIFTPPAGSIYGEMFRLAGAEPISGNASYKISLEELVAADPEVILLGDGASPARPDGVKPESVGTRAGWGGMTAVKNGRIVVVDDIVITRPGPRLAEVLLALIKAIHPELTIPS